MQQRAKASQQVYRTTSSGSFLSVLHSPGLLNEFLWESKEGDSQPAAWLSKEAELGGQAGCWANAERTFLLSTQDSSKVKRMFWKLWFKIRRNFFS